MTRAENLELLQLLVAVALLWLAYSYVFQRIRRRAFREDIFTIRDSLFDYMWENGLSFDLSAYGRMRSFLNGSIRTSRDIGFVPLVLVAWKDTAGVIDRPSKLEEAIAAIEDTKTREHFEGVRRTVGARLRKYLFYEGLRWLLFKPLGAFVRRLAWEERLRRRLDDASSALEDELVLLGKKERWPLLPGRKTRRPQMA